MSVDWTEIILQYKTPEKAWDDIFTAMLSSALEITSPVSLHEETIIPDRLISEAAWELWEAYPNSARKTSDELIKWTGGINLDGSSSVVDGNNIHSSPNSKAVLILDALSLRELSILLGAAEARDVNPLQVKVTGSECPSTTDHFAKALGLPSRSSLVNNTKPGTFKLFGNDCYTDVLQLPFEDCAIPPTPNVVFWHSWLDDVIHLQQKNPDQINKVAQQTLQSDGFWRFINNLRQGRDLVITSDHGYAVSKRFSSEVEAPDAVEILRKTFSASRHKAKTDLWQMKLMPPIVMENNNQYVVMGQRKWKVQGGFPQVCHGGMSLLEVAVPFLELPRL